MVVLQKDNHIWVLLMQCGNPKANQISEKVDKVFLMERRIKKDMIFGMEKRGQEA